MAKDKPKQAKPEIKVHAENRKARHIYEILESVEAGMVLTGSEVKSIRAGKATLVDAFADVQRHEMWLIQADIGSYTWAHARNHEARRRRKLLLHRGEIDRLEGKIRERGFTMVPLQLYEKGGRMKVQLALVRGKEQHDRREDTKKREAQREIDRAMKSRRR